jgi:hypothetical protein
MESADFNAEWREVCLAGGKAIPVGQASVVE